MNEHLLIGDMKRMKLWPDIPNEYRVNIYGVSYSTTGVV